MVKGAFRADGAEVLLSLRENLFPVLDALSFIERVILVPTFARRNGRNDVDVMHAAKSQLRYAGQVALRIAFIDGLGAQIVHSPAAPGRLRVIERSVPIDKAQILVPRIGNGVPVGGIGVTRYLIAHRLRFLNERFEFFLAAKARVNGEYLRVSAVVPADIPADQTEFRLVDSLTLELVEDVGDAVEVDYDFHFRLGFRRLLRNRRGNRLPAQTEPNFNRLDGVLQFRIVFDSFRQRATFPPVKLILTIPPGDVRIRGFTPERVDVNNNVLVRLDAVERKAQAERVFPVFELNLRAVIVRHPLDDNQTAAGFRRFESQHRHGNDARRIQTIRLIAKRDKLSLRQDEKAVVADRRFGKRRADVKILYIRPHFRRGDSDAIIILLLNRGDERQTDRAVHLRPAINNAILFLCLTNGQLKEKDYESKKSSFIHGNKSGIFL